MKLVILFLILLLSIFQAKKFKTTVSLDDIYNKKLIYLSKFGVNIGSGHYNIRMKPDIKYGIHHSDALNVTLYVYHDTNFEAMTDDMSCQERVDLATTKVSQEVKLKSIGAISPKRNVQRFTRWEQNKLNQSMRQHMWYFYIGGECSNKLTERDYDKGKIKFDIELEVFNSDESHFSSEEGGLITSYILVLIGSILGSAYLVMGYFKNQDWPLLVLTSSLFFLAIEIILQLSYYSVYSSNGEGSQFLRVIAQTFDVLSQTSVTVLLVMLAQGWTISYSKIKNLQIYLPILGLALGSQILIIFLGFVNTDSPTKNHNYQGFVGILIILVRLLTFGYFMLCINKTLQEAQEKVQQYAQNLRIWGSLYFLSIPICVLIGSILAAYLQQRFIKISTLVFQIATIFALAYSFISKNSQYSKVAMKNRTELPSAFGTKFD